MTATISTTIMATAITFSATDSTAITTTMTTATLAAPTMISPSYDTFPNMGNRIRTTAGPATTVTKTAMITTTQCYGYDEGPQVLGFLLCFYFYAATI